MGDLISHLTEQHQFYLAMADKIAALFGLIYLGMSHPPEIFKKKDEPKP
jgi:hypothetical protein